MEIEIKLGPLTPSLAQTLFDDLRAEAQRGPERSVAMNTAYYDTPGGDFARARQTLRLRREDGRCLCTFKTALNGLSRVELEVPAASVEEGARALLAFEELPPEARAALEGGRFTAGCGAAFTRRTCLCALEGMTFDLCADLGVLFRGELRAPLCEVELELVSGEAEGLQALADRLCARYGVALCPLSKQQRAMALGAAE